MTEGTPKKPFAALHEALQSGQLSRREFTLRALALGVGMPIISFVLRADTARATGVRTVGFGVAAQGVTGAPAEGTDGQERGAGGELKLIQWQAPSMLSAHVSTGTKDYMAACLITEPLLHYLQDGTLIPNLAAEVPTVENGLLAEDLTSVTYKLKEGILWSDGEPLTGGGRCLHLRLGRQPRQCRLVGRGLGSHHLGRGDRSAHGDL